MSRPLFFYVKKAHLGVVPGLKEYVEFFLVRPDDRPGRPARRVRPGCRSGCRAPGSSATRSPPGRRCNRLREVSGRGRHRPHPDGSPSSTGVSRRPVSPHDPSESLRLSRSRAEGMLDVAQSASLRWSLRSAPSHSSSRRQRAAAPGQTARSSRIRGRTITAGGPSCSATLPAAAPAHRLGDRLSIYLDRHIDALVAGPGGR